MKRTLVTAGVSAAIAGGVPTAIGWMADPRRASFAYLFGYTYAFTIVAGSLFLVMIGYACDAQWFVAVRRLAEHVVGVFPLLAVLLVPVLLSMKRLYPWTHASRLPLAERELVLKKLAWLNEPFFVARSIAYFVIFLVIAELLRGLSIRQDREEARAEGLRRKMIGIAAGTLPLVALTLTFASFDWLMSLEPAWYSDIYGVYVFAGGFVSALGLLGVMTVVARKRGALPENVAAEHFHAVGRLELAMIIFWTYIAWAQLILLWIADLPSEVTWYVRRWHGGWEWVGLALLLLHWAFPFFYLLQRGLKRRPGPFVAISAWIVVIHALDVYYLVLPAFEPGRFRFHWLDLTSLVAVGGACVAFGAWRAGGVRSYPVADPLLRESIHYEAAL